MMPTQHPMLTAALVSAGLWLVGCGTPASNDTATTDETGPANRHAPSQQEHAKSEPRTLHLTDEQRRQLPIELSPAGRGSATDTIQAPADIRFDADRVARVGPRIEAKVVAVKADLGDQVAAGDALAVFDSVALGQAKADYLTARAHARNARATLDRKQALAADRIISQADLGEARAAYQSARAARRAARSELVLYGLGADQIAAIDGENTDAPLSRFTLTAPIAGTVQQRDLVVGQTVTARQTPIQIVDAGQMWAMIHVAEANAARVQPGLAVTLGVRALPNRRFEGRIDWVSQALTTDSRTLTARAVVDNPGKRLSADMFATARIKTKATAGYALVPTDAVQTLAGGQCVVFVPGDTDNLFHARPVVLGDEGNGQIEIREGLAPGEAVVTRGAFDLMSALTSGSRSAAHSH